MPKDVFKPGEPLHFALGKAWSVGPDGEDHRGELPPIEKGFQDVHYTHETRGDLSI